MGIWGFILLILNYFGQLHFGVANSLNVLLVQHRDEPSKYRSYVTNSLLLISIPSFLVGLVYMFYVVVGIEEVDNNHAGRYLGVVCLIAVFQYFNGIFANIFRVRNKLNSISLTQSLVVIVPFVVVFLFRGAKLVDALIVSYLISNLMCIIYSISSGILPKPKISDVKVTIQKEIFIKGIFLFLYNTCFAFIVISVRTVVSANYPIEEFGLFTFAFTLGNAVMMLMDAISFIAFPKVISLFSTKDDNIANLRLIKIRELYMTAAHLVIYIIFPIMPLLAIAMPQYEGSTTAFNLIVLALAMNTNNFGNSSLLIARNREKIAAIVAAVALLLNIIVALVLVKFFDVNYNNVALATLFANLFICISMYYLCCKELKVPVEINNIFPLRLLIPYMIAVVISVFCLSAILWLPIIVFVTINLPAIKKLLTICKRTLNDSSIIKI